MIYSFLGSEIPYVAFLTSPRGQFNAGNTLSNSLQTSKWEIAMPINANDQPLYASVVLEAYSNLAASGAVSGGTTEVILAAYFEDDANITKAIPTHFLKTFDIGTVNGDTDVSSRLSQGINLAQLAFRFTSAADTNFTNTTLRPGGVVTLEAHSKNALIQRDTIAYVSGHQAGFFVLPHTPIVTDSATYFNIKGSGSDTARVYQIYA